MVFFKSILAGLVAALAIVLLTVLGFAAWDWWWVGHGLEQAQSGGIGAYVVNTSSIPVPLMAAVVFVAGFWWEFRRAKGA